MKLTGPRGTPAQMTFSLKEGFSRIDMAAEGHAVGIIIDSAKVALPASTFAAPADFQNLSQMMQGMPGMPPGMKMPGSR